MVLNGHKVWSTAAVYADVVVVFGRYQDGAAAVVVPTDTPGVTVKPVAQPLGCRAAGHADVVLDGVRLPVSRVLSGTSQSLGLLTTIALTYGRLSVAWGCVGIIRGCLRAAASHARRRSSSASRWPCTSSSPGTCRSCSSPSRPPPGCASTPPTAGTAPPPSCRARRCLAKYVAAGHAAHAAATAVQVLASAGSVDGEPVARAYRDAKLLQIIEGSDEICQLILAERALECGMTTAGEDIGIGAIHCLLPEERVAVEDLPELARLTEEELRFAGQAGIKSVGVFPDTEPTELAARACRELLAAHPGDPDLMLHIGSRAPDVLIGSDAGKIAHLAGLTGIFPFTVDGLGCAGSSAAWALGRDLLNGDPSRRTSCSPTAVGPPPPTGCAAPSR